MSDLVKSQSIIPYDDGKLSHGQMRHARVGKPEIPSAIREQGIASLVEVQAVVLEKGGSFAVVKASDAKPTALADFSGADTRQDAS